MTGQLQIADSDSVAAVSDRRVLAGKFRRSESAATAYQFLIHWF